MRLSVIVPTLNAGANIEALLQGLSAQDMKPVEVIVIDSASDDHTVEIAERYDAKTIIIPRHTFNHGKARNIAAKEARADVLVFMTQDALPAGNTLLSTLTAPFQIPDIAAAYGRHIPRPDASPLEIFARRFNYPDLPATKGIDDIARYGIKTFFFSDVCSAVRREAFMEGGMFPENVRANEDMLMAAKLIVKGHRVAYVPAAAVIHSHNYSLFRQFKRYYNIGSSLKNNRWVLNYVHAEGEGARFMRDQFRFILDGRRYSLIPYVFLEAIAKYSGYRLGLIAG